MRAHGILNAWLALLALALASPAAAQDKEPTYRGRTLSQWVDRVRCPDADIGDRAVRTFKQLGPKAKDAAPALVHVMVWEPDLNEKGQKVRDCATRALKAIGPDAVSALRAALKATHYPPGIERNTAILSTIDALHMIGPGAKAAIPELIDIFKDPPQDFFGSPRTAAADALETIGPAAVPALVNVLKELRDVKWTADSRHGAAWSALDGIALRERTFLDGLETRPIAPEAKSAVSDLIEVLKDSKHALFRTVAARLLRIIGPEAREAVPTLLIALQDKDPEIRQAAARALGRIGSKDRTAVPALMELLKAGEMELRLGGIEALGKLGSEAKAAVPALSYFLKDKNVTVRLFAARALGQIGPEAKEAAPTLANLLKDTDVQVRLVAADALLRIDPRRQEAETLLSAALRDPGLSLQTRAVLHQLESARRLRPAEEELLKALKDDRKEVRDWAYSALWRRAVRDHSAMVRYREARDRDDVPALLKEMAGATVLNEDGYLVDRRWLYVDGPGQPGKRFTEMGSVVVPTLLDALTKSAHPERFALVLVQIDSSPKMIAALSEFVKDRKADQNLRVGCIRALADIGPEAQTVVPILLDILKNGPTRELRNEAARALGEIGGGDKTVAAALTEAVKDPAINFAAFRGLVLLGPSSVPILLDLFRNKDNWKEGVFGELGALARSSMAVTAMGELGAAGVPALLECLKDKDLLKRTAVLSTLGRMGPEAKAAAPILLELWQKRDRNSFLAAGAALRRIDFAAAKKAGVK